MDDLALVVQGRSAARNARRLEEAARVAFDWANNYCVTFDDSKTELLHFHRHGTRQRKSRGNDAPPRILVTTAFNALEKVTLPDGTVVSQPADDTAVRWLGIWFDRRMNFKYHIRQKAKAGQRAWSAFRSLAHTERGMGRASLRMLYLACVVPVLLYGAEVWWRGIQSDATPLQKVQNSALVGITGAFRTSPSTALHNEAAIPSLAVRCETLQRRYATRLLTLPANHPLRTIAPSTMADHPGLPIPRKVNGRNGTNRCRQRTTASRIGSIGCSTA
jgi:hypothetical protein